MFAETLRLAVAVLGTYYFINLLLIHFIFIFVLMYHTHFFRHAIVLNFLERVLLY